MPNFETDEIFETRLRTGVPVVRAAACRFWAEVRCGCELEDLVDAGSRVLLQAATLAASDAEFLDRLNEGLSPALQEAARISLMREAKESADAHRFGL